MKAGGGKALPVVIRLVDDQAGIVFVDHRNVDAASAISA